MNKVELIEEVSNKVGLTKKEIRNIIDVVTKVIKKVLSEGGKVTLVGFGTFQVVQRKARRGVDLQTREAIQIPAKKVPKFRPGRGLREKI